MARSSFPAADVDYRQHPDEYRMGHGERGVLTVEPYKSELLPHWRFRTPSEARKAAKKLLAMFRGYRKAGDFAGMDMARKFLQMGFTRSRRYARHKSGQKYAENGSERPVDLDATKQQSAEIFAAALAKVRNDAAYLKAKAAYRQRLRRTGNTA